MISCLGKVTCACHCLAGETFELNDITLWQHELAPEALAACAASPQPDLAQRCVYPDAYSGTWNVTLTYGCETLISLPHFYLVLVASENIQQDALGTVAWHSHFLHDFNAACRCS